MLSARSDWPGASGRGSGSTQAGTDAHQFTSMIHNLVAVDPLLADAQQELNMEDGFGDLSGVDLDDLLFDFPGSYGTVEDPTLGQLGPIGDGDPVAESSSAVEDLRISAPTLIDAPSPSSSSAAAAAADDSRAKRKAEQNRRVRWLHVKRPRADLASHLQSMCQCGQPSTTLMTTHTYCCNSPAGARQLHGTGLFSRSSSAVTHTVIVNPM